MAKSRSFSIYLLKNDFNSNNSLKEDHTLEDVTNSCTNLPHNAQMYIANKPGSEPWWKSYWGLTKNLQQMYKGALVFLPINDRWIVLTFGATYHQLKDICFEYDFGLRTTLNAVDPEKIKSADTLQPENSKRQKTQLPNASTLTFFDIRHNESIIKKLTGIVKDEYHDVFKKISGSNSLRISTSYSAEQIKGLCEELILIYEKDDYTIEFPDIQNIVPVKDPDIISNLNTKLLELFVSESVNLVLAIPEVYDDSDTSAIVFKGAGKSDLVFEYVYIGGYRKYLASKGLNLVDIDINKLRTHRMHIIDDNGMTKNSYTIYKSLLCDCEIEGFTYHLCEGEWYEVKNDYISRLGEEINPCILNEYSLLPSCAPGTKEAEYNSDVSKSNKSVICLDRCDISPQGNSQIEPCDLITINDNTVELIHIKMSTRSASLSHLFNQGVNSLEMLIREEESRIKLKTLLNDSDSKYSNLIDQKKFHVVFGIVTKKFDVNKDNPSKNLPIFSRISLSRTIKAIELMQSRCSVYFIEGIHN